MGQDNPVPRRINRVEGVVGQVMRSGGPGVNENWGEAPDTRLQSKVGSFDRALDAADGDVSYTGVGFKPTALDITACRFGSSSISWGVSDSGPGNHNLFQDETGKTNRRTDYIINLQTGATPDFERALVKSYDDDGFTLTWLAGGVPAGTGRCIFRAMR